MNYIKLENGTVVSEERYNRAIGIISSFIGERRKIFKIKHKFDNPIPIYASIKFNEDIKHYTPLECQKWVIEKFKLLDVPKKEKKTKKPKYIPYKKFLVSKYWLSVKRVVLKRDNNKCAKCGTTIKLRVHHLTYKNHFNEHNHLEDLITLCDSCHRNIHNIDEIKLIERHLNSI